MRFLGTFEHTLDERGRVAVPASFRAAFKGGGMIRPGAEGCIELYTPEAFEVEVQHRLSGEDESSRTLSARRARRSFFADAYPVDLDAQGRIVIPPLFRAAALSDNRVAVVGCGDRLEIWANERWVAERAAIAAEEARA